MSRTWLRKSTASPALESAIVWFWQTRQRSSAESFITRASSTGSGLAGKATPGTAVGAAVAVGTAGATVGVAAGVAAGVADTPGAADIADTAGTPGGVWATALSAAAQASAAPRLNCANRLRLPRKICAGAP
jgi:hypothetical protein